MMQSHINSKSKKVALIGILSALAITFSFIENLIPQLPFLPPGAKAGFSNIIVLFTSISLSLPYAISISIIKSIFVLMTRGFTSFLLSLFGGVCSCLVMYISYKYLKRISFISIGIIGAITHNIIQLITAMIITSTPQLYLYLPALLIFGVIFGIVTGTIFKITFPYFIKINNNILKGKNECK